MSSDRRKRAEELARPDLCHDWWRSDPANLERAAAFTPRYPCPRVHIQSLNKYQCADGRLEAADRGRGRLPDDAIRRECQLMSESLQDRTRSVASTGIPGLDDIMAGGFTRRRLFLVEGVPARARRRWPCSS